MLGLQLLEGSFIASQVGFENVSHLVFKLLSLVSMMEGLDGLLEPDGNEKAYRDSCNVYEEIFPGMDRQVRRVNFEHRCRDLRGGRNSHILWDRGFGSRWRQRRFA